MANSYTLVNPLVQGEMKTELSANNSIDAARQFYKLLSEHFSNAVPKFHFSIQKGDNSDKLYHFEVVETRKKDNVSFTISPFEGVSSLEASKFTNKYNIAKKNLQPLQEGGKSKRKQKKTKKSRKHKDSESESESSSESEVDVYTSYIPLINYNQPIYYWWYDPSIYKLESYFIPTFFQYSTPILQITM
jgi:hypothetical protein